MKQKIFQKNYLKLLQNKGDIEMNVISISGNLCKDIGINYTKNNKMYTENTIGVKNRKKREDGSYCSDFIDIVAFENKAKYLAEYAQKGDYIEVVGKLRVDSWRNEAGEYRERSYVVVDELKITTSKRKDKTDEKEELPF